MAIVAEILLADETLPLVGVADSIPSGELSISNAVGLEDGKLLLTVSVSADSRDAFERELDAQSQITDAAEIGQTADGWFYKVVVNNASSLIASHDPEEFEGVAMDATVTCDGIREQKVFSDYEAFSALRDRCAVNDIPLELLNIASDPENPGERDQFGLTDRQYRAMSVALSAGYYDWPRESTAEEVAAAMDISSPTLHEHLRAGERKLLESFMSEVDDDER